MKLLERTEIKYSPSGHPMPYGKFFCEYCGLIVEKQISNGRRSESCGCIWHLRNKPKPKKKPIPKPYISIKTKNKKARQYATLHCKCFQGCLDETSKANRPLNCYQCEKFEFKENAYQDERPQFTMQEKCIIV